MTEARTSFPNKLQAFGVVAALIGIEVFVMLIIRGSSLESMMDRIGTAAFVTVAGNGFVFIFLTTYKRLSYRSLFHAGPSSLAATLGTLVLPILFIIPGLALLVGAIDLIVIRMFPMSAAELEMFGSLMEGGVISILFVCIGGPVLEEMLFRGIILRSFLTQYSRTTSILWSATLFGLAHFNIYQFFTGLILGVVLGWLYERTRSLWPSILLHGSFNAFSVVIANADRSVTAEASDLWILGLEIGCAIVGGFLLARILEPNEVAHRKLDSDSQ